MSKTIIKIQHADIHIANNASWKRLLPDVLCTPPAIPVTDTAQNVAFAIRALGDGMLLEVGGTYVPADEVATAIDVFAAWLEADMPPCGIPGITPTAPVVDPDGPPAGGGGDDGPGQGDDPPVAEVDV